MWILVLHLHFEVSRCSTQRPVVQQLLSKQASVDVLAKLPATRAICYNEQMGRESRWHLDTELSALV